MTGLLPVDKPADPTSHDVVAAARKALDTRRIGHTGTLDPFATGLLLLCIGSATRLAQYFSGMEKRYEAIARLGITTDTLDGTGSVTGESDAWEALEHDAVVAAFEDQRGRRRQRPPTYSAKRIGGKKSYELARAGRAIEPVPVEVEITALDVSAIDGPNVRFTMRCSTGTYVRAVARDAGEALGVGAHLTELRRTAIGPFDVADAVPMAELGDADAVRAAFLSPLDALGHLPRMALAGDQLRRVTHGQSLEVEDGPEGLVALVHDGELMAVAESDGRWVRPKKVFA